MESIVTISAAEYRKLIEDSVKAAYGERIAELRAEFDEERNQFKEDYAQEHESQMFWWRRSCEFEKQIAELNEEIKKLKEELAFYAPAIQEAS